MVRGDQLPEDCAASLFMFRLIIFAHIMVVEVTKGTMPKIMNKTGNLHQLDSAWRNIKIWLISLERRHEIVGEFAYSYGMFKAGMGGRGENIVGCA